MPEFEWKPWKVVALVSGGKDSLLAMHECVRRGCEIVCVASLLPHVPDPSEDSDDLDSFCFQTVGGSAIPALAECLGVPLRTRRIKGGQSLAKDLEYQPTPGDEVEEMFELLNDVKRDFPEVDAVCSGAILSSYQRLRVENVSERVGLTPLAPLWQYSADRVLDLVAEWNIDARLIKVSTMGLFPKKHLGKSLVALDDTLRGLAEYGSHPAGEGGEFETFVFDCALFGKKKLEVAAGRIVVVDDDPIQPTGRYAFSVNVVDKEEDEVDAAAKAVADLKATSPHATLNMPILESVTGWNEVGLNSSAAEERPKEAALGDLQHGKDFVFGASASRLSVAADSATTGAMEALRSVLSDARYEGREVLFVMIHAPSMGLYGAANKAYTEVMSNHGAGTITPGRAFVALAGLEEIVFDVYFVPQLRSTGKITSLPLHVKSTSNWAAPCIGPYAQAKLLHLQSKTQRDLTSAVLISGRIGMDPWSQELVTSVHPDLAANNSAAEFAAALHNALAVLPPLLGQPLDDPSLVVKFASRVTHITLFCTGAGLALSHESLVSLWQRLAGSDRPVHIRRVEAAELPKKATMEVIVQVWPENALCDDSEDDSDVEDAEGTSRPAAAALSNPFFERPY